ncbi:MAG: hypothetical protein JWR75_513 [Devosia sp.]|nr:hypothetical protein [Devosia sp.]
MNNGATMTEIIQISLGMFINVFVTLGFIFLVTRALPILAGRPSPVRALVLGTMFGVAAIASMLTAFPISEGIYGDMRNAIVAIAAICGGPVVAVICAAFAIAYRFALGGQYGGAIATIVCCMGLSVAFHLSSIRKTTISYLLFGLTLALLNAAVPVVFWLLGLAPFGAVVAVAETIFGSAILLYPVTIALVANLVRAEMLRLDAEAGLRATNAELSLNERRFRDVFDLSCIPMAWTDLKTTKFVRVNQEYERFTGYGSEELEQMTFDRVSVPEDREADLQTVTELSLGQHKSFQNERRYRRKDGSIRWGQRTLTLIRENGEPKFGFAMVQDITERRRASEQIAYLAEHDHLTGLTNRFQFGKELDAALAVGGTGQIAVFVLDLDDFKGVNDTLGHQIGDQVLVEIADRLRSAPALTNVARIGGDEFAVTKTDTTADEAVGLAEHILTLLKKPVYIEGQPLSIRASVGIALSPRDGTETSELFKKADIALYAAKAGGKGNARLFEAKMEATIVRRGQLKTELAEALARSEFEVEYQPVIDIATGRVISFEALLRWNHPANGRTSPAEFIPIAEETGSIIPIGAWVLEEACSQAAQWPIDIGVAVNVSVRQFEQTLPLKVATALSYSGLNPSRLEIEITESVLMQGNADSLVILHQLKALGVKIALDDFGTGFSSLSYLQRFPFDKLKIDRSFINGTGGANKATKIVEAVVQLGHSLGMRVTAEGIETGEQLERMRDKGCDQVQGFLFSRSVPAREVGALIERLHANSDAAPRAVQVRRNAVIDGS